ncbi:MAG TPA: tRNA lysidine(34) synthetase TilS [Candidatus Cloacimonadota bacterium]|nr:tRNA lysidine(34) synthetase TilS [Candidatus Cloacimonadota bacterium]
MSLVEKALHKLTKYIESQNLIASGDKLLLGCSGGADSLAMLLLFTRLRTQLDLSLLVLHLNHQSRGPENEREAELVKSYCQKLNVPLVIRKLGPLSRADFENQAHLSRAREFELILRLYKFDKIVLGHHKNDQAETVLMNLIRGAGINGMSGIKPISGDYLHPLLSFTHAELCDLLKEEGITWAEDPSNEDNSFRRNYLRNSLIPQIREELNPNLIEKLSRQAMINYQAEQILREAAVRQLKKATIDQGQGWWILDLSLLTKLREIEQYYVLKKVVTALSGTDRDFFWHSFEEILGLYSGGGSKFTTLQHGITVRKVYQELHFSNVIATKEVVQEPLVLDEDRNRAVFLNYRFSFKYLKVVPKNLFENPNIIYLDADKIEFPITIRTRTSGDRFIPRGMKDLKKLKDFFIDEKVPKFERDNIAVFADGRKIIWIAGYRADQRVCPDEKSVRYLQITAESLHEKPKRAANRTRKQGEDNELNEL